MINYFTKYDNKHGTDIGSLLDSLRLKRGNADYEEDVNLSISDAQLAFFNAEGIIEEVSKIPD